MVQTSSLVVFTAVAFGAVSSVVAVPVVPAGQTTPANPPTNSPAQGALAAVDSTIAAQQAAITRVKDEDALADQKQAAKLEAEAKALDGQAYNLDPALRPKSKKEKGTNSRLRESEKQGKARLSESPRLRSGTSTGLVGKSNQTPGRTDGVKQGNVRRDLPKPGAPAAPGGDTSRRPPTPQAAAPAGDQSKRLSTTPQSAIASTGDQSKRPVTPTAGSAPGANGVKTPQAKVAQALSGPQLLIQQQDAQLKKMEDGFAAADRAQAKLLQQQEQALMKQAQTMDPALAQPPQNGASTASKPAPRGFLFRRAPGQPGAANVPSSVGAQNQQIEALKVKDATADASEASSLQAQAQQLTTEANELDPTKPAVPKRKSRKDKKKEGMEGKERMEGKGRKEREGKQGDAQIREKTQRGKGRQTDAQLTPAAPQAPVVRFYSDEDESFGRDLFDEDDFYGRDLFDDDDMFGRELFDDEELYGREWYDLEELD